MTLVFFRYVVWKSSLKSGFIETKDEKSDYFPNKSNIFGGRKWRIKLTPEECPLRTVASPEKFFIRACFKVYQRNRDKKNAKKINADKLFHFQWKIAGRNKFPFDGNLKSEITQMESHNSD